MNRREVVIVTGGGQAIGWQEDVASPAANLISVEGAFVNGNNFAADSETRRKMKCL